MKIKLNEISPALSQRIINQMAAEDKRKPQGSIPQRFILNGALAAQKREEQQKLVDKDNILVNTDIKMLTNIAIDEVYSEYLKSGSVHKTGDKYGVCGETIRKWINKSGRVLNRPKWEGEDIEKIKSAYSKEEGVDIKDLANSLNRTHAAVACKAEEIGVTASRGCQIRTKSYKKAISKAQLKRFEGEQGKLEKAKCSEYFIKWHSENEHPRGMLGKHHSSESKFAISKAHMGKVIPRERVIRQMKTKLKKYGTLCNARPKASWKASWQEIGGKRKYFRSRWESNYAKYLQFQKENGLIKEWHHECETFWFDGIKRGCVSYLPDFKVETNDGNHEFHEVKGWMDSASKTKIKRMAKYYPKIILKVFDSVWYRANSPKLSMIIKDWEK